MDGKSLDNPKNVVIDYTYNDLYSAWIEETFQMHVPPTNKDKTTMEDCQTVPTTCYGQVSFDSSESATIMTTKSSPFIRLSSHTKPELITQLLRDQWNLRLPRIIISVTGGATTFELPPLLDKMIRQGLKKATMSSNAWIITCGTNTGVMKYVGDAIKDVQSHVTSPLIGIAPWSVLNNKSVLERLASGEELKGGMAHYGNPDKFPRPHCSLDRNHSHFILVDDGTVNQFGGEIGLRADIEQRLGQLLSQGHFGVDFPISNVIVVIQGGPNTVHTCAAAARNGIPIVAVDGSGKAADAIAYAHRLQHDMSAHMSSRDGLARLVHDELLWGYPNSDVHIFQVDFYGRHEVGLDVAILDAVFRWDRYREEHGLFKWLSASDFPPSDQLHERGHRIELKKGRILELALTWDRVDIAKIETSKYRIIKDFNNRILKDTMTQAKARMLKWALVNDKIDPAVAILGNDGCWGCEGISRSTNNVILNTSMSSSHESPTVKQSMLKSLSAVPLPPILNTDPLPSHCKPLLHDVMAAKYFSDLKFYYNSPLQLVREELTYHYNVDVDLDGVADLRTFCDLAQHASRIFQPRDPFNAWHLCPWFDVFFVRFLLSKGYMISKVPRQQQMPLQQPTEDVNDALCETLHLIWVHHKLDDGWTYAESWNATEQQSPLLCAYRDQGNGTPYLNENIRMEMCDSAQRFLETLTIKLRIAIWQPTTLEELYIRPTMTNSMKQDILIKHIYHLFPDGLYWESHIRQMLSSCIGPQAKLPNIYELDPHLLLAILPKPCHFSCVAMGSDCEHARSGHLLLAQQPKPEALAQFEWLLEKIFTDIKDVLNFIDTKSSKLAEHLLCCDSISGGLVKVSKLAFLAGDESVLSSKAFLRVLTTLWYGKIDPTNRLFKIFLATVFPPYLIVPGKYKSQTRLHDTSRQHSKPISGWDMLKYRFPLRIDSTPFNPNSNDTRNPSVSSFEDVFAEIIHDSSSSSALFLAQGKNIHKSISRTAFEPESPYKILLRRIFRFYRAPVVGFTLDTLSYIALLIIYSYSALLPTVRWGEILKEDNTWVPILTLVWMITLIVEEVRQVLQQGIPKWWSQLWNRWDAATYILYIIAIGYRFSSDATNLGRARYIYSVVAVMLWLRLARSYAVNQDLGPKLIMIQLMIKDIRVFIGLMALVYFGYSIALYSVLEPYQNPNRHSLPEMLFIPYFQIYGELFLDDMREKTACPNIDFTDCGGHPGWFAAPLLAVYMLIANIVLVNLLIAMMSSTYEKVQSQALELWAYQNLDALNEVNETWFFPAPFHIIHNIYLVLSWLYKKLRLVMSKSNAVGPGEAPLCDRSTLMRIQKKNDEIENVTAHLIEKFWESSRQENQHAQLMESIKQTKTQVESIQRTLHDRVS
eukprot:gene10505-2632_t